MFQYIVHIFHIRTRPIFRGDTSHVQIWTSYVKALESYRLTDIHTYIQTDRHDQNYYTCCFGWVAKILDYFYLYNITTVLCKCSHAHSRMPVFNSLPPVNTLYKITSCIRIRWRNIMTIDIPNELRSSDDTEGVSCVKMFSFFHAEYKTGVFWMSRHKFFALVKATPTIVGEAFIFYLWTFFATHRHSRETT